MAGSMMQSAAILWHVSVLVEPSRRGLALGLVGLVRAVPIIAFSLGWSVAHKTIQGRMNGRFVDEIALCDLLPRHGSPASTSSTHALPRRHRQQPRDRHL